MMMDQTTKTTKPMTNIVKRMMAQRVGYSFFLAESRSWACETDGERPPGVVGGAVDDVVDLRVVVGGVSATYLDKINRLLFSKWLIK
jgi:hypothetical protein